MTDLFSVFNHKVERGECTWEEILSEINAIKSENTRCDYLLLSRSDIDVEMLNDETNPYKICKRRQVYALLSNEAKQIAGLIISIANGGFRYAHLENELVYKDKITTKRVYNVVRKKLKWSMKKIEKVFDELRNYCNELNNLE